MALPISIYSKYDIWIEKQLALIFNHWLSKILFRQRATQYLRGSLSMGYPIDMFAVFAYGFELFCLHVGNQCGQGFSLAFGRLLQFAVLQERCDAVQQKPSVSVEYKLQFIFLYLSQMRWNTFQHSLRIRRLQRLKVGLIALFLRQMMKV